MNSFGLHGCKKPEIFVVVVLSLKECVMIPLRKLGVYSTSDGRKIYGVVEELSKWGEKEEYETI